MCCVARPRVPSRVVLLSIVAVVTSTTVAAAPISAAFGAGTFQSGNLLVSTSVWTVDPNVVSGTTQLPPGCGGSGDPCATAIAGGAYPTVFNNDGVDGSFGVTQPIVIDEITTSGTPVSQLTVPNSTQSGVTPSSDQMVTSFPSKSEIALNLSTDGNYVDFMGYTAPVGAVDVSNSNTPGVIDPTNPVTGTDYRAIAQMDQYWQLRIHRDQRLQRQQRPGRHPEPRHEHPLPVGQRRQRREPRTAGCRARAPVRRSFRRRTRRSPPRAPARRPHSGTSTSPSSGARRRQVGKGRQLPRPDDQQQRPLH